MKTLLVANLIGDYGKKISEGLTTNIENVRLPYTINKIYRVKAISTLDCGIISPSFPCIFWEKLIHNRLLYTIA